jgi:hypothetical protein
MDVWSGTNVIEESWAIKLSVYGCGGPLDEKPVIF